MGFDQVRIPIVAHWAVGDNRYRDVRDFSASARSRGMNLFASVANTNGRFKRNGDLDDAHNGAKFASWLKGNSGANRGIYGLNLPRYKTYLQDVLNRSIGNNVRWVGPFNEDPANANDYARTDPGRTLVGVESFGLANADTTMRNVRSRIDIGGAHDYGLNDLRASYTHWRNFRNQGGRWFTESTLFAQSTAQGIAHILPAISEGMERIVIYQTIPRMVTTSGGNGSHFAATNHLMQHSRGRGRARRVDTNNKDYVGAAFVQNGRLILHLCNISRSRRTMFINLQQGYRVSNVRGKTTYGGTSSVSFRNSGSQVRVALSGRSYVRVELNGLTNSRSAEDKTGGIDEDFVYTKEEIDPDYFALGDIDFDGKVGFLDITPFMQTVLANFISSDQYMVEADMNGDGFVDMSDVPVFFSALATGG